ncbi:hypothetical protein Ptr902_02744 [Pyrenophora tritici-repentis]|nr:hypothetical protein Ptr902_02744 [Pyrenophora tritici-repentis]
MVFPTYLIALLSIYYLPAFVATAAISSVSLQRSPISLDSVTSPATHSTLQKRTPYSQDACDAIGHHTLGDWEVDSANCDFFGDPDGRDFKVNCIKRTGPGGYFKSKGKCPDGTTCYPVDNARDKSKGDITCATPKQIDIWQAGSPTKQETTCSETFENKEGKQVAAWFRTSVSRGEPIDIEYLLDGRQVGPIFYSVALGVVKVIMDKGQQVKACVETRPGGVLGVVTTLLGTTIL